MAEKSRKSELMSVFGNVDANERMLISKLVDEVTYLEERMAELRKMPFIEVHADNPARQRSTPAAKQYKECSQSYMNAIRILLNVLRKTDIDAENELLKKLEEFE